MILMNLSSESLELHDLEYWGTMISLNEKN